MVVLISFAKAPIARKCTEFSDCSASEASQSYALLLGGDEADVDDAAPMPSACNLYCKQKSREKSQQAQSHDGIKSHI